MDLVDDHETDVPQMALHHLSRKNRLKGLGGRDEEVRWSRGLPATFGGRGVPVADGRGHAGRRHQALDTLDQVSVEGPKRSHVQSANPGMLFSGQGLEYWQKRRFGFPGSGGGDNQNISAGLDVYNCLDLHFVETFDSCQGKETLNRDYRFPRLVR